MTGCFFFIEEQLFCLRASQPARCSISARQASTDKVSGSILARAIGRDLRGRSSPLLYLAGIAASLRNPWVAGTIHVGAALMRLVPDRCIECTLSTKAAEAP